MYCHFSGPLLALALAREDAVTGWKEMLGPKEVEVAKEKAPDRCVCVCVCVYMCVCVCVCMCVCGIWCMEKHCHIKSFKDPDKKMCPLMGFEHTVSKTLVCSTYHLSYLES